MIVEWFQCDNGSEVEKYLQEKYNTFKNVEILGITESRKFNVFVLLGDSRRRGKK